MRSINLVPWREMRRREQNRKLLTVSIGAWLVMGIAVFYAHWYYTERIEGQTVRNNFLKTEIAKVNAQIKEIQHIRERKQALIERMEVIAQLQQDRSQIVHLFDDLVHKLPKGVYVTGLNKRGKRVTLTGFAQSNARISALMRDLDSSDWFGNPDLAVINVTPRGGARISKFTLRVNQTVKKKKPAAADEQTEGDTVDSGGAG